jgi:WD40 repeat protein
MVISPDLRWIATTGEDNTLRLWPVRDLSKPPLHNPPHLILGHRGLVRSVAFSPDGRWLASSSDDKTIRLWPVPDATRTPPHKRSREEFLATLRSWTNVRVLPDSNSPTGWRLDADPFPGWAKLPVSFE